ncbi:MAG: RDD family protein [Candidatus Woesearchaeota archaeon]
MTHSPAPFWKRVLSLIFDLAIMNLVIFWAFKHIFTQYAATTFKDAIRIAENPPAVFITAMIIISLLALCYFVFFEYYLGQTPGQMILSIQVIDVKTGNAESIPLSKAFTRNLYILPFFPFYILWIIELVHLGFYKERFLERITQTQTIIQKPSWKTYNLEKVK